MSNKNETQIVKSPKNTGSSTALLNTVLNIPNLPQVLQQMQPLTVVKLIDTIGVEDCAEIVECLSPEQLLAVLDEEIWKSKRVGEPEKFKMKQAIKWIRLWADLDEDTITKTFNGLGRGFLATLIVQFCHVQEMTGIAWDLLNLDGLGSLLEEKDSPFRQKYGNFNLKVRVRDREIAYVFLSILNNLWENSPELLLESLAMCCNRSHQDEFDEEELGRDKIAEVEELLRDNLAHGREQRRAQQGFIAPERAREILERFRRGDSVKDLKEFFVQKFVANPTQSEAEEEETNEDKTYSRETNTDSRASEGPSILDQTNARTLESIILESAGPKALLLSQGDNKTNKNTLFQQAVANSLENGIEESEVQIAIAGLSNLMLSGCNIAGKRIDTDNALQAVISAVTLGLNTAQASRISLPEDDITLAFQIGLKRLREEVALPLARVLDSLVQNRSPELLMLREHWLEVAAKLGRNNSSFAKLVADGKYFDLSYLFAGVEHALCSPINTQIKLLLSEFPVLPNSLSEEPLLKNQTNSWKFFSSNFELEKIAKFIETLPNHI